MELEVVAGIPKAGDGVPVEREFPSTIRMLLRGVARRCPRCGARHVFATWFAIADRCPRCHYLFDREAGFFLGAFVINSGLTVALLALLMGVMIAALAAGASSGAIALVAAGAVVETVIVPVLFYPSSKTTWAAIDLAMHRGERWGVGPAQARGPASTNGSSRTR